MRKSKNPTAYTPLKSYFPRCLFNEFLHDSWVEAFEDGQLLFSKDISSVIKRSPIQYLNENECHYLIFERLRTLHLHYREFKAVESNDVLKVIQIIDHWEVKNNEKHVELKSLALAHCYFLMAINEENPFKARKFILLANTLTDDLTRHPYLELFRCLCFVSMNNWEQATKSIHTLAKNYPNPTLIELLIKLYVKLDMPRVAQYWQNKIHPQNKAA